MARLLELDPRTYRRHPIHQEGRIWAETNCYADVWIELLHALGHDPAASLAFTLAIDFEGDQWTFFKCPLRDLRELYGLDVQELALWRPLAAHLEEQLGRGRPVLVELDSFYLPDTAGTAYRRLHWKSTAAIVELDLARARMGYFHNQGYYHVGGEDLRQVLRLDPPANPALLPPYAEFVKIGRAPGEDALLAASLRLLREHLVAAPAENPFAAFRARLERDLGWLLDAGLDTFHQYSFATLRQYGACYELSQTYLQWLAGRGEQGLEPQAEAFRAISEAAKAFQFQLARAMSRRRPPELSPIDAMGERWEQAMLALRSRYC